MGRRHTRVTKFQMSAPNERGSYCALVDARGLYNPAASTAVDMNVPETFRMAAMSTALDGDNTRVDTTVAIALAASCQPLEKSKARASITTRISAVIGSIIRSFFDDIPT